MEPKMEIVYTNERYAESYNKLVDEVARERKYLSTVSGFSLESSKWYVDHMRKNNFPQYFLVLDQTVIGWCDIKPKDIPEFSHVGVLGIGIAKQYRGNGYGTKLLRTTMEHAKSVCHLEKVELTVFESNENAIKLYQAMGFTIEGKRMKSRKIDGKYDNEIEMGLFLA
jgi:RimJ/RimL family protein N-acetyltransferase